MIQASEPIFDLAHLGHVEMYTPKLDESVDFFVNIMGLTETTRHGDSVYLRGWDDYEHHTLKLTANDQPGIGHMGWRTTSPQALERRAQAIEAAGYGLQWTDGDLGHGRTYQFNNPDGHLMEIYYETDWYAPPDELKPALKNQAMKFPARGANLRRLDHVNIMVADPAKEREFFSSVLGAKLTEQIVFDDGRVQAVWFSVTNKSYEIAIVADHTGHSGRLHHVTFAVDCREDVLKTADICLDNNVPIETGPHKHAINQTFFLYVFEPGGNRFEIANAGARLIFAPDWKTCTWNEEERKKGQAWGLQTVKSFHTYGTPPIDE
ncbi:MAG: catechol 2,3-dioxygenase [Anaerolineae bacterium]|nr:catechol 2,3-dioxygenase [Anaerolineae bacterium]